VGELLKQGVYSGQIVLMIDTHKKESCIADLAKIGRVKVEAVGRTFREKSNAVRYTNIRLFKGLESDIVFMLGSAGESAQVASFYTRASRARLKLFVYSIDS
ncbi:MAG: hypothetical protein L7U72_00795, partial [Rubripirellula sp.]|nr:hypothetical protein [Rubripirellula sp.]